MNGLRDISGLLDLTDFDSDAARGVPVVFGSFFLGRRG